MALLQILKAKTCSKFRFSCFLKSLGEVIIVVVVIKWMQWKEREADLKQGTMLCILNIPFLYYLEGMSTWKKTLIEIKTLTLITVFAFATLANSKGRKRHNLNAQAQHTTFICRFLHCR